MRAATNAAMASTGSRSEISTGSRPRQRANLLETVRPMTTAKAINTPYQRRGVWGIIGPGD